MSLRSETGGLVAAVLLHAAAFAWLGRSAPTHPSAEESDHATVDLDVEDLPREPTPLPEEPSPAEATDRHPSEDREESVTEARLHRRTQPAPTDGRPASSTEPSTPAPASSSSDFAFDPTAQPSSLSGLALGMGGPNPFIGNVPAGADKPTGGGAPDAPEGTNVAPGVDRSMRDALVAHDHAIGLDVAGPLVGIAEEAARPSEAPMDGAAVFEVTFDGNGAIAAIRVVEGGKEREAWERVARAMTATFRSRRMQIRAKGKGLVVTLEVSSRWVLPSGQHPGLGGVLYSKPDDTPGSFAAGGAHFDLSDIGQRAKRDVHARILNERSL
jgi:hypothetical protein